VLAAIAAHKRYPEAALPRGARGVAVVTFTIGGSGEVASAQLSRSAGDATLDADAVATVRRTSPFPPPPAGAPRRFAASLNYMPR
jgi:TonB family protein